MTILKLFANEDKVLLVGWNPLLVLNLGLHIIDGVGALDLQAVSRRVAFGVDG